MFSGASLIPTAFPKPQFRAVILCGYGQDLYPLIEQEAHDHTDEDDQQDPNQLNASAASQPAPGAGHHLGQTKALLPVAGRRMIDWVLDGVEQAGVFGELSDEPTHALETIC